MHLSILKAVACFTSKAAMALVWRLLAATPVGVTISTIPTRKGSPASVQFHAEFGGLHLQYTISASGRSLLLSRPSAMTPTVEPSSTSMETTGEETTPPLLAALFLEEERGNAFVP